MNLLGLVYQWSQNPLFIFWAMIWFRFSFLLVRGIGATILNFTGLWALSKHRRVYCPWTPHNIDDLYSILNASPDAEGV